MDTQDVLRHLKWQKRYRSGETLSGSHTEHKSSYGSPLNGFGKVLIGIVSLGTFQCLFDAFQLLFIYVSMQQDILITNITKFANLKSQVQVSSCWWLSFQLYGPTQTI